MRNSYKTFIPPVRKGQERIWRWPFPNDSQVNFSAQPFTIRFDWAFMPRHIMRTILRQWFNWEQATAVFIGQKRLKLLEINKMIINLGGAPLRIL